MSYTLETLDEGRIIIVTFGADFSVQTEMKSSMRERLVLIDAAPDRVVLITDSREFSSIKVEDMIAAANQVNSDEGKQITKHPKVIKSVNITSSKLGLMVIKGLNTAAFGNLDIPVFGTLEEGIEYARKLIVETGKVTAKA